MTTRLVRFAAALLVAAALAASAVVPVLAHDNPCDATEPGHSGYAQHHIVFHASVGGLGAGGHIPGVEHMGYAGVCGVLAH